LHFELVFDYVKGDFDAYHLKKIKGYIFQDLPEFGFDDVSPGQFRPATHPA